MGFGTHLRPNPRCIEISKDLGWRQEVGPGAIKWLPLPPPGLARLWVRARHKRRVASVPTTLPPPLSALRKRAERRGLWAGPRAAGARGEAGASLDAAEAPWGALHAAPSSAHTDGVAEEKRRGKARLTWGAEGAASDSGRGRCLAPRALADGRRWRSSELGSTSRGRVTPLATRPRAVLFAVTAPSDAGTLLTASSVLAGPLPSSRGSPAPAQTTPCHLSSPPLLPL